MTQAVHPFFDPAQVAAFDELTPKKDSTFELTYFGLHGFGSIIRVILVLSGAKFTNKIPADWPSEKPLAPFGVMPLLKETSADGKTTINICESDTIERYLAKKFDLVGDNAFEETIINSYVNNTNALMMYIFYAYYRLKDRDPALKAEVREELAGPFAVWANLNEKHLVANGSNGHFVGNKLTLADIKAAYVLGIVQSIRENDVTEESHPALWKVKNTVDSIPSYKAWRETEEYQTISKTNFAVLAYY
ncbi:Glutathione S-transferase S1 [Entomortierella chlamydospora]|uniref:Glutathione S-transferase S1 n=1 Tax=Entomortierella chlamydospora TaxID=101097 RepID=A0A9P6SZP2_9FUNG|nr:Glutathione S-transferase S1 [Entomortierella chlamydospora]KAG0014298.1 Glutathione S-transferase S1 [Entomortierella chlamydospora]